MQAFLLWDVRIYRYIIQEAKVASEQIKEMTR